MIRIGSRRSPLAVSQAQWVADRLADLGHTCELVGITSQGDVDRRELTQIGGTGVFAAAVRDELLAGRIDLAVHSLKDLPTAGVAGLEIVAYPRREDARDVLVGLPVDQWTGRHVVVGTGSPRRAAQVREWAVRDDLDVEIVPLRGNVGTRLSSVAEGRLTATLLAAAGLRRLGLLTDGGVGPDWPTGLPFTVLPVDRMVPAAGQGALAIEARADSSLRRVLGELDDDSTRTAVSAERAFLTRLEAGCTAAVGVHGAIRDTGLTLAAIAEQYPEHPLVRRSLSGPPQSAGALGSQLAQEMLDLLGSGQG